MSIEKTIVLKFGGAAVATPESFSDIADIVISRKSEYARVAVVVSAMGDTTDELIALAHRVNPLPPKRELDMLISAGERISVALLAMALHTKNADAMSFTGSQSGIITSCDHTGARIVNVKPHRLFKHLELGKIVIIAGFQGVSVEGEITTLGRGGSDTSAVALALALGADKVEFYKDVDGVFDCDPKKYPNARLLPSLDYSEAGVIVSKGAQVLQERCIDLAHKNGLILHVLPFMKNQPKAAGTRIENPKVTRLLNPVFE